jgi:hypothetical protein
LIIAKGTGAEVREENLPSVAHKQHNFVMVAGWEQEHIPEVAEVVAASLRSLSLSDSVSI